MRTNPAGEMLWMMFHENPRSAPQGFPSTADAHAHSSLPSSNSISRMYRPELSTHATSSVLLLIFEQSPLPPKIVVISYLLLADPNPLPQFNLPDSRRPPIKARHRQSLAGGDAKLNLTLARPLACLATASSLDPEHIHSRAHGTLAALLHAPSTPKRMRRATGTQPASSHRSFPQTRAPM